MAKKVEIVALVSVLGQPSYDKSRWANFFGEKLAKVTIYAVSPKATQCPFVVERTHFAGAELGASCWVASASRIGRRDVDMSVAVAAAAAASKRRVILAVVKALSMEHHRALRSPTSSTCTRN